MKYDLFQTESKGTRFSDIDNKLRKVSKVTTSSLTKEIEAVTHVMLTTGLPWELSNSRTTPCIYHSDRFNALATKREVQMGINVLELHWQNVSVMKQLVQIYDL